MEDKNKIDNQIRPADIVICLLVFIITSVICVFFYFKSLSAPSYAVVTSLGKEYVYPLYKDYVYNVPGMLGETVIEIKNREVEILSSPCMLKTCSHRKIKKNTESLVCLPNGVAVQLRAVFEQKNEYDAISF